MTTEIASYAPQILDTSVILAVYEDKLQKAEKEVAHAKKMINLLKKSNSQGAVSQLTDFDLLVANLKWRSEIRHCLNMPHKTLMSSNEVATCIAIKNNLPGIDRNIKTKISSTLSMMHKEGEIGRAISTQEEFLYGRKELFDESDKDLKTVLPNYSNFLVRHWKWQ